MNIKTLELIHKLLIENEQKTLAAHKICCDARNKAEDEGADNFPDLRELSGKLFATHSEALDALQDFEARDW